MRACNSTYRDEDENKDDNMEPWEISVDLIECIANYYKANPHEGAKILTENQESQESNVNEETNKEDVDDDDVTTDSE